jgi:hypothetical protein
MRRTRSALLAFVLAALAIVSSTACSGVQTLDTSTIETTTLGDLAENAPDEGQILTPEMEPMIIEIPAGEMVPLAIDVQLPFLTVEAGKNSVRFQRDLFVYLAPDEAMISFDGERWARVGDWDALKEIAGAEQGSLSVGLGVSEELGPQMHVGLKLE